MFLKSMNIIYVTFLLTRIVNLRSKFVPSLFLFRLLYRKQDWFVAYSSSWKNLQNCQCYDYGADETQAAYSWIWLTIITQYGLLHYPSVAEGLGQETPFVSLVF